MSASTRATAGSVSSNSDTVRANAPRISTGTSRTVLIARLRARSAPRSLALAAMLARCRLRGSSSVLPLHPGHHGRGLVRVRGGERREDLVVVPAVDGAGHPALPGEPFRDAAGPTVAGRVVVHHDGGERAQPHPGGHRDGLVVAALVQFSISDQYKHPRREPALSAQPERGAHREA